VDALTEFKDRVRRAENTPPLDDVIHVCEFTGFTDSEWQAPGCMLHPSAPGNQGIDFRGICHYGSMACKTFFCPAWEESDPRRLHVVLKSIDDWHLYGLVVTDPDFVRSLFGLLEESLGGRVDERSLLQPPAARIFKEMISWKDSWPLKGDSHVRRSRYYFTRRSTESECDRNAYVDRLLDSLEFTFGTDSGRNGAQRLIEETVDRLTTACRAQGQAGTG